MFLHFLQVQGMWSSECKHQTSWQQEVDEPVAPVKTPSVQSEEEEVVED
jgi:hypothetical protein